MAQKEVSVRITSQGGDRLRAELIQIGQIGERSFGQVITSSTEMQARIEAATGAIRRLPGAAQESAAAFQSFDRMAAQVRNLQAQFDPAYAAAMRYESAIEQLDAALKAGVITQERYNNVAAQAERAFLAPAGASRRFVADMDAMGGSTRELRGQLQNAGFQVQDFFVQVGAGTSPVQALSQQLPQLLGSMGLIGVLAGTAVAAVGALGMAFLGARDDAAALDQTLRALDEAVSSLESANGRAAKSFADLQATYGANAEAAQQLFELEQRTAQLVADRAFGAASRGVADAIGGGLTDFGADQLRANADLLRQAKADYAAINAEIEAFGDITTEAAAAEWEALQQRRIANELAFRSLTQYRAELETISDAFNVSEDAAAELAAAVGQVREADTSQERLDAARALAEAIYEQTDGLTNATDEGVALYQSLVDAAIAGADVEALRIAATIGAGADQAERLEAALARAAYINALVDDGESGPDAARRNTLWRDPPPSAPQPQGAGRAAPRSSGGGGGVGGGGGGSAQNDMLREAQRLYEATRTEAEKFAAEQAKINELLRAGAIDGDTHARALDMIKEKYGETSEAAKFLEDTQQDLKDAFTDLALEGEASFDASGKAIRRALLEAMLWGDGPLGGMFGAKGLFGGAMDSAVGWFGKTIGIPTAGAGVKSMDGGGDTGNGPRSGGVDGKGGFWAILHPQETVIDHTKPDAPARIMELAQAHAVLADGEAARDALMRAPSFNGGGATGNAARSGGLDGKGGFLAVLHPQETVIDHTKPDAAEQSLRALALSLRSFDGGGQTSPMRSTLPTIMREGPQVTERVEGGGNTTVVQINNYSGQPVTEERERGPSGEEIIRVTVGRQLASGEHDKAMGRYSARPAKVKR